MLSAAFAAVAMQSATLNLTRGGPGDADFRYWAVRDTFLDSSRANDNFGRDPLLSGGPGKTILIQFGDLRRMVGSGKRIKRARLLLSQRIGETPELRGAFRVLSPWGEGPGRRGLGLLTVPIEAGARTPNVSATWSSTLGGLKQREWQSPGGRGSADREPLPGTTGVSQGDVFIIEGLGATMQAALENPSGHYGLSLEFANAVDFASSEAPAGRPVLQVEIEDAPPASGGDLVLQHVSSSVNLAQGLPKDGDPVSWTAHVRNAGAQPTGLVRVTWNVDGVETVQELPQGISPGADGTVTLRSPWKSNTSDHRTRVISVRAEMTNPDRDRANNTLHFYEGAAPVTLKASTEQQRDQYLRAVEFLNEVALPMSRFSFALDGGRTGFRVQAIEMTPSTGGAGSISLREAVRNVLVWAGMPSLSRMQVDRDSGAGRASRDAFAGVTGGGDTRNDENYPTVLGLTPEPWFDAAIAEMPFDSTDLLSATEVGILHARMKNPAEAIENFTPRATVLRVLDSANQLVKGARLEFFERVDGKFATEPAFAVESTGGGIVPVPNQGRTPFRNFADGVLMVRVIRGNSIATGFLKSWQLVDSFSRGNADAGIIPLRLPMPSGDLARVNLAENRILTDSFNTLPAELEKLLDGNAGTVYTWPQGKAGWIEVDLQRDRRIGAVELRFANGRVWDRFRVLVYSTGQKVDAARAWATEVNGGWMLANRGTEDGVLSYFGPIAQVRYLRIEVPEGMTEAQLAELRVLGLD